MRPRNRSTKSVRSASLRAGQCTPRARPRSPRAYALWRWWGGGPPLAAGHARQPYHQQQRSGKGDHAAHGHQLVKSLLKKFLTDWPKEEAPAFAFSQELLAGGSAALPASLNFSPVNLAPSSTVLPTPLAVCSTPLPTSPCPI